MPRLQLLQYYAGIVQNLQNELPLVQAYNATATEDTELKTNVKPCFFSGTLGAGRIVVLNLNPKYTDGDFGAIAEQAWAAEHYPSLHAFHENRFRAYREMGDTLNATFREMCRHIAGQDRFEKLQRAGRREQFLQRTVLNLDWCYYYSRNFTGNFGETLNQGFEGVLKHVLSLLKPRFIYAMGKSGFENTGFIAAHSDIDLGTPLIDNLPFFQGGKLYQGTYRGLGIPLFYLNRAATKANDSRGATSVNAAFCEAIPGLSAWLDETAEAALADPTITRIY